MVLKTRSFLLLFLLMFGPNLSHAADSREKEEAFIRIVLENKRQPIIDMLEKGANVNQITGTGQTILCAASMLGKAVAVKALMDHGAKLLDDCLVTAVANGQVEITALFLDRGKKPDTVADENGDRLLHMAVRNGDVAVTGLLLERGADVSLKNTAGETPHDILVKGRELIDALEHLLENASR